MQCQESDLAFAARLLEPEGIAWWLRGDGSVVLADHAGGFAQLDGGPLPVHDQVRPCAIWTWKRRLSLVPGTVVIKGARISITGSGPVTVKGSRLAGS